MNCDDANDLMVDSLLNGLEPEESTQLETHLGSCARCRKSAEEMRRMWNELGELAAPQPRSSISVEFGRRLERRGRKWMRSPAVRAASIILLVAMGVVLGRLVPAIGGRMSEEAASEFLLLIRGDQPSTLVPETQLVQEYGAWADRLAAEGQLVTARKLAEDEGRWLNASRRPAVEPPGVAVGGFFIVRAESYEEAVLIARESPHLSYGGTIEVRAIEVP